ncbi:antibiotic biosynthesis monooxygenase [Staphylococcus sp. GSSP0090]|nr:antibiotic biosynthesis monooxygenase [Staphylococcus sp. GSSP0090]
MFIAEVAFSTNKAHEQQLYDKVKKTQSELHDDVAGLIASEVWTKSKADDVEYVVVSKWEEKKDFQNWVARPSHVEEHKAMHKKSKNGEAEKPPFQKTLRQYTVVTF